jgi:hypothetical protein
MGKPKPDHILFPMNGRRVAHTSGIDTFQFVTCNLSPSNGFHTCRRVYSLRHSLERHTYTQRFPPTACRSRPSRCSWAEQSRSV